MQAKHVAIAIATTFAFTAPVWAEGTTGQTRDSTQQQGMSGQQGQQMSNNTVRQVQEALQSKGHNVGQIDGVFGPSTQSALREFQRAQGLEATGRADQRTLASLGVSAGNGGNGGSSMHQPSSRNPSTSSSPPNVSRDQGDGSPKQPGN